MGAVRNLARRGGGVPAFKLSDLGAKLLAHFPDTRIASNVTVTGSGVSNWVEPIGNKPFIQATDASRPIYSNGEIILNQSVTNHGLTSSFSRSGNDMTVFVVMRNLSYQNNQYVLHGAGTSQMILRQYVVDTVNRGVDNFYFQNSKYIRGNYQNDNSYHVYCFEKKASVGNIIRDANNFSTLEGLDSTFNFTSLTLGNSSALNFGTKISVKEIIITTGTLTDAEKFNVINLLNTSHGTSTRKLTVKSKLYNSYVVNSVTVAPDTEASVNQYCSGLTYDPNLQEIAVVESPRNYIRVFDTSFNFLREFPSTAVQGLAKDYVNDVYYAWIGSNQLRKMSNAGVAISTQSFVAATPGQICLDYSETNLVMWVSWSGSTAIQKWTLNPGTGNFEFTSTLVVNSPGLNGEGIAWDSRNNTLWIHQLDAAPSLGPSVLVNIDKSGNVIDSFNSKHNAEGLAINAASNLVYSNHDTFYHGGVVNGNICISYYPEYLKN